MAFGSKNSTPSFVLTLPLDISLNEQDYLYKEFKKCGTIYNQLVSVTTKMWHQLRKMRKYRELMAAIAKAAPDSDEQKVLFTHNSLPCMRHGDKPCHRHPGIPRLKSWEVSRRADLLGLPIFSFWRYILCIIRKSGIRRSISLPR